MPPRMFKSSYPSIEPLDVDLLEYLFSNPNHISEDKAIFIDGVTGAERTFGDIQRRTKSLAHGLREWGVGPRDIVALFSPNTIDYGIICYGVLGCGATVSPVSAAYTAAELQVQIATSGARHLVAHSSLMDTAKQAIRYDPTIRLMQADGERDGTGRPTAQSLAENCPATPLVGIKSDEAGERLCFLCFSSGTTGRAKGVMTTHRNLVSNMQQWQVQVAYQTTGTETTVTFLPFSHMYGLTSILCVSAFAGNTAVVLPRFDLELYLGCIQTYRPQTLSLVPPVMLLLAKHPLVDKYDLSSVKILMCAAAPLSVELRAAVEARFRQRYGTTVLGLQAWGLTETSPLGASIPPDRPDKRHTVGNLTPSMEYRVVDPETLQDTGIDDHGTTEPGELWCRGPNVTIGYYRNDEATRHGFATAEDGTAWFRTGDIATIDRDGFLTIVDRIKEMIKYKGLQVIPSELEGKLLEHPDVEDACVVGRWVDESATEVPVGFVVLRGDARQQSPDQVVAGIHRWLNARVANHKRLRGGVHVVEAVPKSPSGKILRRQLRDLLKSQDVRGASKL